MSAIGHLGIAGLAIVLTLLLWFGTQGGGKMGTLSWGWVLFLSMVAGSSFRAAGPPFSWISDFVMDGVDTWNETVKGTTMPAIALSLLCILLFKKLTLRQVAITGIAFWTVAAGAGAGWGWMADHITLIAQKWA